ncbi:hypothetical protein Achl_4020 (plasmid) [Pseudarthrobacter chlorophenolicus A6]|uniref:Uncharacterized protein n=1 Tax=Pseudarthrobacter chlorophenolicus (strain ATCC 700700 / DSM 12829 / CIP 107037 / JCM 12360 / KCTC 9906 / NCIMB 13794 / A6) TaxID=452863 RepID=B8HHS4_PSECP|nr:hypothetical protein [Pseudarthrobacter chlorophenolicus]ACL41971.1 hypothetical protein Achl_4020 [Pseudarthrobacter chlorophenolicus A6]SDQ19663.1 hypothetical protein SAMN04489738_0671 [Pseudarthrobacter chlorophenolicus]
MSPLAVVPSPAQMPAARQNARLYLQARALTGIQKHLNAGGTDTEFMLRLASHALAGASTASDGRFTAELQRHTRGLQAIRRHLTVGGTDRDILVGLTVNALTGYSPATAQEAREARAKAEQVAA